jgi:glycerate kinase
VAIVGGIGEGAEGLFALCESTMQTVVPGPMSLDDAIRNASVLYEQAADRLFRAIQIGMHLIQ